MNIKNKIKKIFPNWVICILKIIYFPFHRFLCMFKKIIMNIRGNYYRSKLQKQDRGNRKLRIVFLVYVPQSWNSLKTVYEAAQKNPQVTPLLVVLPNYTFDGKIKKDYNFFKKFEPNAIDAFENNIWLDLKKLKPDIIFQQSPYDEVYPKGFRSFETCRYAKVCYIPYGYNSSPKKHLQIEYNDKFMANVYAIFVDSKTAEQFCSKYIEKAYLLKNINIIRLGFPRFDLCYNRPVVKKSKFTFTWIPRWSLDEIGNNSTSFFMYKEKLINFFKKHKEIELIIRPHQLMFSNFIKLGIMTKQEIYNFYYDINNYTNISFDEEEDYWMTFDKTDVLIADFSSLDIEFFLTGKPLIYLGDISEFNRETFSMVNQFYIANNWIELEKYICDLKERIDVKKENRKKIIENFCKNEFENVGENIIKKCLEI